MFHTSGLSSKHGLICTVPRPSYQSNCKNKLPGIWIGRHHATSTVLAHADGVSILMTSQHDLPVLQTILDDYTAATGARISNGKSAALATSTWDNTINIMQVPYVPEMKILGIHFASTVTQSAIFSWAQVTGQIRSMTRDAYYRELCLARRILYIHCYVLAMAWYTAQIFPIPAECIRQINSAIAWYLWRGEVFRVPMSTLLRENRNGGWDLVNLAAKSRTLFICRLNEHSKCDGMLTHDWFRHWKLQKPALNPRNIKSIPDSMEYLHIQGVPGGMCQTSGGCSLC
jgi:hypothetical protein